MTLNSNIVLSQSSKVQALHFRQVHTINTWHSGFVENKSKTLLRKSHSPTTQEVYTKYI